MFFLPTERTLRRRLHYKILYWAGIAIIFLALTIILSLKNAPLYVWYVPLVFNIIFLALISISLRRLSNFIKLYPDILLLDNKMIFTHLLMFVLLTFVSSMALPEIFREYYYAIAITKQTLSTCVQTFLGVMIYKYSNPAPKKRDVLLESNVSLLLFVENKSTLKRLLFEQNDSDDSVLNSSQDAKEAVERNVSNYQEQERFWG